MLATVVIKRPIITEKATGISGDQHRYTFLVDPRATKTEIRKAIEELYKVRVLGVNTQNRKGAARRYRYGVVTGASTKRAIVKVHPDDVIELF